MKNQIHSQLSGRPEDSREANKRPPQIFLSAHSSQPLRRRFSIISCCRCRWIVLLADTCLETTSHTHPSTHHHPSTRPSLSHKWKQQQMASQQQQPPQPQPSTSSMNAADTASALQQHQRRLGRTVATSSSTVAQPTGSSQAVNGIRTGAFAITDWLIYSSFIHLSTIIHFGNI